MQRNSKQIQDRLRRWMRPVIALLVTILTGAATCTWADENNPNGTASDASQADARTMLVFVLDEQGEPLPDASIRVSIWEVKGEDDFPNKSYTTNEQGIADVALPQRLRILRLWPSKTGYVRQFVNFAKGTHAEGRKIPDRYEFRLAKGTTIGGVVQDDDGNPIEGASIEVRVDVDEPPWGPNPEPMISNWLTNSQVQTDATGSWQIDCLPAKRQDEDFKFQLKVTHPRFVGDTELGGLQSSQKVTPQALREGTATITLARGAVVTGKVTDANGNPIPKGSVFWKLAEFGGSSKFELPLGEQGEFVTPPLPEGEHTLYVVAPDYAPLMHTLLVEADRPIETDIVLKAGKQMIVRVLDPNDQPIANARFRCESWRAAEPDNHMSHRSVLDGKIPKSADAQGLFTWDAAAEGATTFRVGGKGFLSQTVTLYPNSQEHVVRLAPQLIAHGRVTNKETGKPVEAFDVIAVELWREDWIVTQYSTVAGGDNGEYEIALAWESDRDKKYGLRIEADGFRTFLTDKFYPYDAGSIELNYQLEPAIAREGIVLTPEGIPAEKATIVECSATRVPHISNGKPGYGTKLAVTNANGKFESSATCEPLLLLIQHETGFAEVQRAPDQPMGEIQLQSWASLEGHLYQDGQPVADQDVYIYRMQKPATDEPRYQGQYYAKTDAQGRFNFPQVPTGERFIKAQLGPWRDSPLTASRSLPLDLKPGEHRKVTLGGDGKTIAGKVVATGRDNAPLAKNWSINYLISRDSGITPLPESLSEIGFDPIKTLKAANGRDPDFELWRITRDHYFVKLSEEGDLRITGVPPGSYDLLIQLYEQPAGCLVETVGTKVIPVEVPASETSQKVVELGEIEIPCRAGPRIGEDMRAYPFIDATGRGRRIDNLKGQYALMHVWASWCAPCMASMPDIRATVETLANDEITFIGLNVDEDKTRGEQVASAGSWHWAQNFLGSESDMARQLAISSVPTYYLIGPEGKLVASSTSWSEIKQQLLTLLKGESS